jgi:hypothetical protein
MITTLNMAAAEQPRELTATELSAVSGAYTQIGFYIGPVGFALDLYDNGKWEVTMVNGDSVTHMSGRA